MYDPGLPFPSISLMVDIHRAEYCCYLAGAKYAAVLIVRADSEFALRPVLSMAAVELEACADFTSLGLCRQWLGTPRSGLHSSKSSDVFK